MIRQTPSSAVDTPLVPEPEVIVSHPDRVTPVVLSILVDLLLAGGTLAVCLTKQWARPEDKAFFISFLLVSVLVASVSFTAAFRKTWRCELRADANGLSERDGRGNVRFLAWEDVEDYYNRPSAQLAEGRRVPPGIILGRHGERFRLGEDWVQRMPLAKRIKERAVRARVHDWVEYGARAHDGWPRTFHYRTWANDVAPWIAVPFFILAATAATVAAWRENLVFLPLMGWTYCVTLTLLPGGVAWVVAMLALLVFVPDKRTRARREQRITILSDGLRFEDGRRVIVADWEAVRDTRRTVRGGATTGYVVQTEEDRFEFTSRISNANLLAAAILYNAPRVREWRVPEDDDVLPTRHVVGASGFVHHYRTRGNRFNLCTAWGAWGATLLGAIVGALLGLRHRDLLILLWVCGLNAPLLGWFTWLYFAVRVERDGDGLTLHGIGRARHVPWIQITDFRRRFVGDPMNPTVGGLGYAVVESCAGRLAFWVTISECHRLFRAIEAQVPGRTPPFCVEPDGNRSAGGTVSTGAAGPL